MSKCNSCKKDIEKAVEGQDNLISFNIFSKIFCFLVSILVIFVLIPIIFLVCIIFSFNAIVMDRSTNILPSMTLIWNIISKDRSENIEIEETDEGLIYE